MDLGSDYLVVEIILNDRLDSCNNRLENTEVRIGHNNNNAFETLNPICFLQDIMPLTPTTVYKCSDGPMNGRFVMVRTIGPISTGEWAWAIREFQVFVMGSSNIGKYLRR